mgnify:CR=1 FL=1|jgi:hypothetical protein
MDIFSRSYVESLIIKDSTYNIKNNIILSGEDLECYVSDYCFYIKDLKSREFYNDAIKLRKYLEFALLNYNLTKEQAVNIVKTHLDD